MSDQNNHSSDIIEHISEDSGKIYHINLIKNTCDCKDFILRRKKSGSVCKHIRKEVEKRSQDMKDYSAEIMQDSDAIHFVEKHGEDVLAMLKLQGKVYEARGKLFLI